MNQCGLQREDGAVSERAWTGRLPQALAVSPACLFALPIVAQGESPTLLVGVITGR